jgi:hypothetical protein
MLDFPDIQGSDVPSLMLQDIVRAAIPGKILLAVWGITGGIMTFQGGLTECQSASATLGQSLEASSARATLGQSLEASTDEVSCEERHLDNSLVRSMPGRPLEVSLDCSPPIKRHRVDLTMEPAKDAVVPTAESGDHLKATKRDDAAVRTGIWLGFLMKPFPHLVSPPRVEEHLKALRRFLLARWKRCTTASLFIWLKTQGRWPDTLLAKGSAGQLGYELGQQCYRWTGAGRARYRSWWQACVAAGGVKNWAAGRDCIRRTADSTWWKWDVGSSCFFWRWPSFYQGVIRDGMAVLFVAASPTYFTPQPNEWDPEVKRQVAGKLGHARERGYIGPGRVRSLTSFFSVPKGLDDIRMVYDASKSGLNDAIWVPRFPLPTIATHLRAVECGTYMADLDVGEMFLNFMLHEQLQEVCGVDLTHYCPVEEKPTLDENPKIHERWTRAAMGLRSSPYQAVQAMSVAEEIILGDRLDATNPFRWNRVRLNLPGQENYDSSLPWVSKVRANPNGLDHEVIASDVFIYVDDVRITGPTELDCWSAAQRVSCTLTHLGIQDAARKRREPRQDPGAWAGAVLRTNGESPTVEVSQEKWEKTKSIIAELESLIDSQPDKLPLKRLLEMRGFLLYVSRTYRYMTPHLKGLHLTIDAWRGGRDIDGWKVHHGECDPHDPLYRGTWAAEGGMPKYVKCVPRLREDVEALRVLTLAAEPPKLSVRCQKLAAVYYGFGDASGKAFGSTFQFGDEIVYRYGQWCSAIQEESSNYKELGNLVSALKQAVEDRALTDCEIFLFTDNTTAEGAYYKGNTPSRKLFELVLELKQLGMRAGLILHVVHVSGKRMIAQGTDGLSRGDHTGGVMQGRDMTDFIPLHLTAFDRSPSLKDWVGQSFGDMNHTFLGPEGWFSTGHLDGNFIWTPPPTAADVVVEQLGKARHKRPNNLHLVIVPRLMTGYWRRAVTRECDGCFEICLGFELWKQQEFEPLIVFVCLPFRSDCPSPLHTDSRIETLLGEGCELEVLLGNLRSKQVWEEPASRSGDLLRKLLLQARGLG